MSERVVAVVPHTHWDREWYLPFQAFRLRLVELLDGLLPGLDADPAFAHFMLDGQLAVVDDYLAVRPEREDDLKRLVDEGRVTIGPWYTLPDEFLVSGETLVRDLQLGLRRASDLGGAMEVGYLPDMFGHVAQMPQLLRLLGIDHAVVWRGVPAAVDRSAFTWRAPDGSEVRAEYLVAGYGNGARVPTGPEALVERVSEFASRHATRLDGGPLLWMNGTDHLLPQPWLPEVVAKANAVQDEWRFEITSLPRYLDGTGPAVSEWDGELRSGARANLLMGVASNRVDVKQAAARAERALERLAEPLSALFLPPGDWPARLLDEAWLAVIRNAAHDSVCACSDDEVVDAVLHRYAEARQIGDGLADRAVAALGATVAADGPVVVNPSPRARSGLVEMILPGEEEPAGTQTLRVRPAATELGSFPTVAMAAGIVAELEYLSRYTSARIEGAGGETLVEVARDGSGSLVGSAARRELERLMAGDGGACRVVVTQAPGRKVLARVDGLAGYGWRAWEPSALDVEPVVAVGAAGLTNGLVTVAAGDDDHSFSIDGVPGFAHLVDGGDVGDTYNWCPPDGDRPVDEPVSTRVAVLEAGPLRGRLELRATYATDRGGIGATTVVELRAGERLVRVETTIENRARDHRLRATFPLPRSASTSEAECAFAVVERGLTAEGGPTEVGLPTFPSRRFVRAGGLTVVHEGLLEYELVDIAGDGARTLALTLLRCTGMLSQGPMATRPMPAGPFQPLEGPQLQKRVTLRYGVAVGDDLDPYALVDDAFVALRATAGGGAGAPNPREGSALTVSGAEVSAVRRTPEGALEIRVFNPTAEPVTVSLPERSGTLVDLRGRRLGTFDAGFDLPPWAIATAVLDR